MKGSHEREELLAQDASHVSGSEQVQAAARAASLHAVSRVRRRAVGSKKDVGKASSLPHKPLLSFESLPDYLQDNEFIVTGYRNTLAVKESFWSFFKLHNETGNIWSHFIGFVLFFSLTVWMVNSPPTPLILATPHLEELWHAAQQNMHSLKGSVEENLHQLHLPRLPKLQLLQDTVHTLQDSWSSGVHTLQESVHNLQETVHESVINLQESVHSLQESVQIGAHQLAGQLQHGLATLLHEGRVAGDRMASVPMQMMNEITKGLQWPTARWPMYVFCAGAMSCLLLSAFCHLLGCCQKHITVFIWRLDYAGIALLIVSSFYPAVYYSFLCQPYIATAYLSVITVLGAAAISMSLLEHFQRSEWRTTRAGLYVGLGLMGVVPLIHAAALHSDVWHVRRFVVQDVLMGISYLSGAAIYALRVPERWFPGRFDMVLHSHQVFHLCVVLGAYLHWRAVLSLLEWRDASGGCAVPVRGGPLSQVLAELSAHGHELLAVDQVWEGLRRAAQEHMQSLMNGGVAEAPAMPPGMQVMG